MSDVKMARGSAASSATHRRGGGGGDRELGDTNEVTDLVQTDGSEVEVGLAHTKNLGNYESLRVNVSVRLPSTREELVTTINEAQALAEAVLVRIVDEWTGNTADAGATRKG